MSSARSSAKRAFPEALRQRLSGAASTWSKRLVARRGAIHPPLLLGYRQIFILPTRFGWMIGVLLTAMLLGSLNFNNNLGLFTTFLVAGIGLLSMHLAHRNLEGVEVRGVEAGPVFAGAALELAVRLRETRERCRDGLVATIADAPPSAGVDLGAGGFGQAVLQIPTLRRGWLDLPRVRIRSRYPIGWFEAWSWIWPERRFRVWPRPADEAPPLPTASEFDGAAEAGDESDEFHGLREWREGDPLHRIAWKASQRHQSLLARQYARPRGGRVVLRLSDAPGADLEQRLSVLARWVLDADREGRHFGLELGSSKIAPAHGEVHRKRCLDQLADY
ncbi:MAG: DUF58 domain-containing protein [Xanthomonadaceae bacterium]|nr:DUF58 domain-containing protein [Xanthomonadaceae bacterium]